MFKVIEFSDSSVAVIRAEWLTPRKHQCLWPPHKISAKFNKCLVNQVIPDDTWPVHPIRRVLYESDDLMKAKKKCRQAESESEVASTDVENIDKKKRRKRKTRYLTDSDDDYDDKYEERSGDTIKYPIPPKNNHHDKNTPAEHSEYDIAVRVNPRRLILENFNVDTPSSHSSVGPVSPIPLDSLDETLKPKEKLESSSLGKCKDVIARHLAHIEETIKRIELNQQEILSRVRSSSTVSISASMPGGINIPCDSVDALQILENWISIEGNNKLLENYFSFVGGHKTSVITRRILEKIFTNNLATLCNWTGKNKKTPLKDLRVIQIVRCDVRRHKISELATDAEINNTIGNWFRFTKDRDGGREKRRSAAVVTQSKHVEEN